MVMLFGFAYITELLFEDWECYDFMEKVACGYLMFTLWFTAILEIAAEGYLAFYLIGW